MPVSLERRAPIPHLEQARDVYAVGGRYDSVLFDELLANETSQSVRPKAYDALVDVARMKALDDLKQTNPHEYQIKRDEQLVMVDVNIKTFIAELCGLETYQTTYVLHNQKLVAEGGSEPMDSMMERGVKLALMRCNEEDKARTVAELIQFQKLEVIASLPNMRGKTCVLLSPQGSERSMFTHNFVDFLTIEENGDVTLKRRNSTLTAREMAEVANEVADKPLFLPDTPVTKLKEDVIIADTAHTESSLFEKFGTGSYKTDRSTYQRILKATSAVNELYKQELAAGDPDPQELTYLTNALINITTTMLAKQHEEIAVDKATSVPMFDIYAMSRAPVAYRILPCGSIGEPPQDYAYTPYGFTQPPLYGVMDLFAYDAFGGRGKAEKTILCCTCPFCKKEVEAEIEGGKISCPNCKKSASYS